MERYGRFSIKIWKREFFSLSTTCNTRIQEGLEFFLIHNPCLIKGSFFFLILSQDFTRFSHKNSKRLLHGFSRDLTCKSYFQKNPQSVCKNWVTFLRILGAKLYLPSSYLEAQKWGVFSFSSFIKVRVEFVLA